MKTDRSFFAELTLRAELGNFVVAASFPPPTGEATRRDDTRIQNHMFAQANRPPDETTRESRTEGIEPTTAHSQESPPPPPRGTNWVP